MKHDKGKTAEALLWIGMILSVGIGYMVIKFNTMSADTMEKLLLGGATNLYFSGGYFPKVDYGMLVMYWLEVILTGVSLLGFYRKETRKEAGKLLLVCLIIRGVFRLIYMQSDKFFLMQLNRLGNNGMCQQVARNVFQSRYLQIPFYCRNMLVTAACGNLLVNPPVGEEVDKMTKKTSFATMLLSIGLLVITVGSFIFQKQVVLLVGGTREVADAPFVMDYAALILKSMEVGFFVFGFVAACKWMRRRSVCILWCGIVVAYEALEMFRNKATQVSYALAGLKGEAILAKLSLVSGFYMSLWSWLGIALILLMGITLGSVCATPKKDM